MAELIVIGYPDEATAEAAAEEARHLADDLVIKPDQIAVIRRDTDGKYHVHTSHHAVGFGRSGGYCSGCCSSSRSSGWPSARGWARSWAS